MKKVLIANALKSLCLQDNSLLNRTDISVFAVATNDELLKIHREEKANLIVTTLDLPGLKTEALFDAIRQQKDLQAVSTILLCEDGAINRARSAQCCANAVLAFPVAPGLLQAKAQQLLEIAPRQSYRVTLNVAIEGKFKNKSFLYRTDNISLTGMLISAVVTADEVLTQGDQLTFSFYLPDGTRVSARGSVERVLRRPEEPEICLYGVKFTDLSPAVKKAIEAFIKKELGFKKSLGVS